MSRRAQSSAPATPALRVLQAAGVDHTARPYEHDAGAGRSYGQEAARALEADPQRVFKTLIVEVGGGEFGGGTLAVAVVPVSQHLDLKALAAALGVKHAALAEPAAAERATGYVRGGISPLGQRRSLPTILDASALEHATVLVSGGRRGLDVELAPDDLVMLTSACTAWIGR